MGMAKQMKQVTSMKDHEVDIAELEILEGLLGGYVYYQNIVATSAAAANCTIVTDEDISGLDIGAPVTCTIDGQPDVPRNVLVFITDDDAGEEIDCVVVVTGKNVHGQTVTETFVCNDAASYEQVGAVIFATITSVVITGSGGEASDLFDLGQGALIGLPAVGKNGAIVKLVSAGTEEAAAAEGHDAFGALYVTPTTAPDAAKDYEVWYTWSPRMWAEAE